MPKDDDGWVPLVSEADQRAHDLAVQRMMRKAFDAQREESARKAREAEERQAEVAEEFEGLLPEKKP